MKMVTIPVGLAHEALKALEVRESMMGALNSHLAAGFPLGQAMANDEWDRAKVCVETMRAAVDEAAESSATAISGALADVLALVRCASHTLSVEDYGDALVGAQAALEGLIDRLKQGGAML